MNIHAHALWMLYLTRGRPWRRWAVLWSVAPDLAYVPMILVYHVARGWSLPVHLAAWEWAWQHPLTNAPHAVPVCIAGLALVRWRRPAWFSAAAVGWGSHVVIDAVTHVTDAYPLLWPFTDRRFPSVVSYWDPAYYGREFFLVNHVLLSVIGAVLVSAWIARRRASQPVTTGG